MNRIDNQKENENLLKKLLDKIKRKKENDDEIKKIRSLKKKIKQIKTVEELEEIEDELDEIGIQLNHDMIDRLKKKKKKKLERQNQSFQERIRCDLETINRIIETGKAYKQKARQQEEKEMIQAIEEREKKGGQKDKEKDKKKDERTRSGGGRSRDSR